MKRTKLVRKWRPGDRRGNLFYISSRWRDHSLSRFCTASEISSIVREFVLPIPKEERQTVSVSVGIEVYAKGGGHKRVVLGRWRPTDSMSVERFVQDCKGQAAAYKVVYPPTESVECHEPEE